jgi:hypothetical protein
MQSIQMSQVLVELLLEEVASEVFLATALRKVPIARSPTTRHGGEA